VLVVRAVCAPAPVLQQLLQSYAYRTERPVNNTYDISSSATTCRYADAIRSVGRARSSYLAATIILCLRVRVRVLGERDIPTLVYTNRPTHARVGTQCVFGGARSTSLVWLRSGARAESSTGRVVAVGAGPCPRTGIIIYTTTQLQSKNTALRYNTSYI